MKKQKMNTFSREDKLRDDSKIYRINSKAYEEFSQAEDSLGKVSSFLKPLIKRKVILDLGCGTGKFITNNLVSVAEFYHGIEPQKNQLRIAKKKTKGFDNCKLHQAFGESLPFKDNFFDVIIATWVIGSIYSYSKRKKIVKEMQRVLKENGKIYLVENDVGGDFKNIIEEGFGDKKTMLKTKWLENNGFIKVKSIKTNFKFDSFEDAKKIFKEIWDETISSKIKNNKISHNVIIFKNGK